MIRREEVFSKYSIDERRKLIFKMLNFINACPITCLTAVVDRKEASDKVTLSGKLAREISKLIYTHSDFFESFDKFIIYYDNGQNELSAILNAVLSIHFSNVEFRKAEPQKYRLLQAADFVCSMELLRIKRDEKRLSKSEKKFFYKPYEWLFNKEHIFHMMRFEMGPEGPKIFPVEDELTEEQKALSKKLKNSFPDYVNSLGLKDIEGNELSLDSDGEGSFKDYVMSFVLASATKEHKDHDSRDRLRELSVPGSDVDLQDYITFTDDVASSINFDAYVKKITRMKAVPAFDALDLKSPENEEFGDDKIFACHFTAFSANHSKEAGELADEKIVELLNPTKFIGACDTTKNWRIRHGAFDRDTSIAIPVILATFLRNKGYNVDFALPWGLPHSGDYDLQEAFEWIDSIV